MPIFGKLFSGSGGKNFRMHGGEVRSAKDAASMLYAACQPTGFKKENIAQVYKCLSEKRQWQTVRNEQDFDERVQLYFTACTLRVLITTAERDKRYEHLLKEFKTLAFSSEIVSVSWIRVENIDHAIANMALLYNEKQVFTWSQNWLSWAQNWLSVIGINRISDPVPLRMLVELFIEHTSTVRKWLNTNRPI